MRSKAVVLWQAYIANMARLTRKVLVAVTARSFHTVCKTFGSLA